VDKTVQVLVNLLSNALEASAPHGAAGVRWTATPEAGSLVIWDRGPGFEGDGAQLFAPWHTTKPNGTGLGLAISHRLVRAHDWNIRAERVGGETRFCVTVRAEDIVGHDAEEMVDVA
jgi:signal transduction histidine kinase